MAYSINKVTLLGNLTRDPEIRAMPDGTKIFSANIATSQKWKDRNTGEDKEQSEFTNVSAFGPMVDVLERYCQKGSQVYIEGKLKTDSYVKQGDPEDRKTYSTKVTIREFVLLGRLKNSDGSVSSGGANYPSPTDSSPAKSAPTSTKPTKSNNDDDVITEDDIPF